MSPAAVVAPLVLAAVLALAAVAKLSSPGSALSAMRQLRLPEAVQRPGAAAALPYAELLLAAALVLSPAGPAYVVASTATVLLMLAYWALVARGLALHPRPACGCFGRLGSPIGPRTLVRNTLFLGLSVLTLVLAWTGGSTLRLLGEGGAGDRWWLLAAVAAVAAAWLVAADRAPRPVAPVPAPAAEPLDYERQVIPAHVLIDATGRPTSLRELAAHRAQLLLWVTPDDRAVLDEVVPWRERMPQIDVRLVTTETGLADALLDHRGSALESLRFPALPGALLVGADGLLAGGPVGGVDEVLQLARDIEESLAAAPSVDPAPSDVA